MSKDNNESDVKRSETILLVTGFSDVCFVLLGDYLLEFFVNLRKPIFCQQNVRKNNKNFVENKEIIIKIIKEV
jgi:hypothetical protein